MATKTFAIVMMLFCTLLVSSAQVFYKKGANLLEFNFMSLITNYNILIGLILYLIAVLVIGFRAVGKNEQAYSQRFCTVFKIIAKMVGRCRR